MLRARACARTTFSTPSNSFFPIPLSSRFLLLPFAHYCPCGCRRQGAGLDLDHRAAASSGTTRRGGPCERGRPRGRSGLSRAPAHTPPITGKPLRGTGGLLSVTNDVKGAAVMRQNHAPLKRGTPESRQPGMACSRVDDAP